MITNNADDETWKIGACILSKIECTHFTFTLYFVLDIAVLNNKLNFPKQTLFRYNFLFFILSETEFYLATEKQSKSFEQNWTKHKSVLIFRKDHGLGSQPKVKFNASFLTILNKVEITPFDSQTKNWQCGHFI